MEYHKINSIYKRDMSQKKVPFILGQWASPVFDYLQNCEEAIAEDISRGLTVTVLEARNREGKL